MLFNLTVNLNVVLSIPGNFTAALNDSTSAAFLSMQAAICNAVSEIVYFVTLDRTHVFVVVKHDILNNWSLVVCCNIHVVKIQLLSILFLPTSYRTGLFLPKYLPEVGYPLLSIVFHRLHE